jgi:polysaccharide export outer membrane protein
MYKILILSIIVLFTGCSSKYRLFQEDRKDMIDSTSEAKDSGFLNTIFPKKETLIKNNGCADTIEQGCDINFRYVSKILPGDTLKIDVYNRSRKISLEQINDLNTKSALVSTEATKQLYTVDSDGTLYLPIINEIKFAGLTEQQASDLLIQSYRTYLTDPYIKVRIANKRVYVLGEVNKPGMLPISSNTVSLYEIIAKSGDLTDYAKRDSIQIISGTLGKQKARIVDLTKMSSLNASNLMIPANSIIYVQPRFMKSVKIVINDFTPVLNMISSTLGTYLSIDYITNGRD